MEFIAQNKTKQHMKWKWHEVCHKTGSVPYWEARIEGTPLMSSLGSNSTQSQAEPLIPAEKRTGIQKPSSSSNKATRTEHFFQVWHTHNKPLASAAP